ncbi:hypothetical protein TWF281_003151 [Arthrobotrys megalospora]
MASIVRDTKYKVPSPKNDRGIQLGFIWLGKPLDPTARDSQCVYYQCSWRPGQYQRQNPQEIEAYNNEFSNSPPMGFHLEINHERWEVEQYRIDIGFVEGHYHDLKSLAHTCKWYCWESITKTTHAVDLDAPWHLRKMFTAPTDEFLPPKHNNPGGKVTVVIHILRNGLEKDNLKEKSTASSLFFKPERGAPKYRVDDLEKPLARFIFKISFQETKEQAPTSPQQPSTSSPTSKTALVGPSVFNLANRILDIAETHKENKYRANWETDKTGRSEPLIQIDEDIRIMSSHEKDMEIMRLRGIIAAMNSGESQVLEPSISRFSESQKVFFPRDMSKLGL